MNYNIQSKKDYDSLIERIKKEASGPINGTYEFCGVSCEFRGTTDQIKEIFDISDEFEYNFVQAISSFKKKQIGPYITEKYFHIIPSIKEAVKQFKVDCFETRRCVIDFPEEHCFRSIQFLIRDNTINVVCFMRSCDAIKNLPKDMWLCSKMADMLSYYINRTLGLHPYKYQKIKMMFGSLHVYTKDLNE